VSFTSSSSSSEADILRREAGALGELAALQRDPAYLGIGVPRGDGRTVLVLPGLFGNDFYLQPLRHWLRLIGYRPVNSTLTVNAGCPQRLRQQVEANLARVRARSRSGGDKPIAIIGHSRGGMLAWAIAGHLRDAVSHLVLLGSPAPAVVAMMSMPGPAPGGPGRGPVGTVPSGVPNSVAAAGRRSLQLLDPDCNVPDCGCPYTEDLRRPLSAQTRILCVYSRDDQIVPASAAHLEGANNVEVSGTHSGLVYNRAVYPVVARFLAER
jgi:triacylglycerol lipase